MAIFNLNFMETTIDQIIAGTFQRSRVLNINR